MRRFISLCIFLAILGALVFTSGCTKIETVYVCPDGTEVVAKSDCKTNKVAAVKKAEAESYATRYVKAYFGTYSGKSQLVSSYLKPDEGDYFATFIVSEKDGEPYETVVLIDGLTGQVSCVEKCDYAES